MSIGKRYSVSRNYSYRMLQDEGTPGHYRKLSENETSPEWNKFLEKPILRQPKEKRARPLSFAFGTRESDVRGHDTQGNFGSLDVLASKDSQRPHSVATLPGRLKSIIDAKRKVRRKTTTGSFSSPRDVDVQVDVRSEVELPLSRNVDQVPQTNVNLPPTKVKSQVSGRDEELPLAKKVHKESHATPKAKSENSSKVKKKQDDIEVKIDVIKPQPMARGRYVKKEESPPLPLSPPPQTLVSEPEVVREYRLADVEIGLKGKDRRNSSSSNSSSSSDASSRKDSRNRPLVSDEGKNKDDAIHEYLLDPKMANRKGQLVRDKSKSENDVVQEFKLDPKMAYESGQLFKDQNKNEDDVIKEYHLEPKMARRKKHGNAVKLENGQFIPKTHIVYYGPVYLKDGRFIFPDMIQIRSPNDDTDSASTCSSKSSSSKSSTEESDTEVIEEKNNQNDSREIPVQEKIELQNYNLVSKVPEFSEPSLDEFVNPRMERDVSPESKFSDMIVIESQIITDLPGDKVNETIENQIITDLQEDIKVNESIENQIVTDLPEDIKVNESIENQIVTDLPEDIKVNETIENQIVTDLPGHKVKKTSEDKVNESDDKLSEKDEKLDKTDDMPSEPEKKRDNAEDKVKEFDDSAKVEDKKRNKPDDNMKKYEKDDESEDEVTKTDDKRDNVEVKVKIKSDIHIDAGDKVKELEALLDFSDDKRDDANAILEDIDDRSDDSDSKSDESDSDEDRRHNDHKLKRNDSVDKHENTDDSSSSDTDSKSDVEEKSNNIADKVAVIDVRDTTETLDGHFDGGTRELEIDISVSDVRHGDSDSGINGTRDSISLSPMSSPSHSLNMSPVSVEVHQALETLDRAITSSAVEEDTSTMTNQKHQGHFVVVAIDFGTTYSGYAFSFTRDPNSIHMMRKWEGGDPGVINQKTITTILLTPDGDFHSFGFTARESFHDLDENDAKNWLYFENFKMLLHNAPELSRDTLLMASNGKLFPALTVFAYALQFFKDHVLQELSDQSGIRIINEDIRWVITVPAIWKAPAKQFMRQAAYEAGLISPEFPEQLVIALEPEVASIYCRKLKMHQLIPESFEERPLQSPRSSKSDPMNLDPACEDFGIGTRYMVVDCGGGTVDITVHEIDPNGKLMELYKAAGGPFGALGVDRDFEELLKKIFGRDFIDVYKVKRPAGWVDLMVAFESRKRSATPNKSTPLNVSLPFSFIDYFKKHKSGHIESLIKKHSDKNITWTPQGMLRLSPDAMNSLFHPTVEKIKQAVGEVINHPEVSDLKYLFLVGGFAESEILQHELRKEFGTLLKIIIPQGVGMSILKGAVLFGLDPTVVSVRRSKLSYGVGVLNRYDPKLHPDDKKVEKDGYEWCTDVFDRYVEVGQPIALGDVVLRSYTPARLNQTISQINIYCSEDNSSKFITDEGVRKCGSVRLDLSDLEEELPHRREIQTRMQFGETEIRVSALDVSTGRHVQANMDFLDR